jgi:putative membrane protein
MPTEVTSGAEPAATFIDFWQRWDLANPLVGLVLLVAIAYYVGLFRLVRRGGAHAVPRRRIGMASLAFLLLFLALGGPLDTFSGDLFFVHMTQHVLLAMAAAPLILGASPMPVYMWALPETMRMGAAELLERGGIARIVLSFLTRPVVALPLFMGTMWLWHLPGAYQLALRNPYVHFGEHFTMFATAAFFWWPIIGPAPVRTRLNYPQRLVYMLMAVTPTAALGAIITLTGHVLYEDYAVAPRHFGMTAIEDLVMAGLIMWIPGNAVYLGTLTTLFFNWAEHEREKSNAAALAHYRRMKRARDAANRGDGADDHR